MSADSSAENTENVQKRFRPNLSKQAQKFGVFEKKLPLGVRSPSLGSLSDRTFPKIAENSCKT